MTEEHCGTRMLLGLVDRVEQEHCPACGLVACRRSAAVALSVAEHEEKLQLIRALDLLQGSWATAHVEWEPLVGSGICESHEVTAAWQ